MGNQKQKLELTWIGKECRPKLEPRILLPDDSKSYHARHRVTEHDLFDNRLIFGDNLLALKALEQEFTGKVKCVFIDPPYNTGSAFEHYDDGVEHSVWLSVMRDRLEMLRRLLSTDGSIWITLDDTEAHYCKVLCDEVFGRTNFVADVIWEKADSPRMDARYFSTRHDHVLVFAKDITSLKVKKLDGNADGPAEHYDKTDEDGRPYYLKPLRAMGGDDARADRPTLFFPLIAPDGTQVLPYRKDGSEGRWRWSRERTETDKHLIEWIQGRTGWAPYYRIYGDKVSSRPPETIWTHSEVGSNRTSKAEIKALFGGVKAFDTPKPERLIGMVLNIASDPADLVLDSFAGSGTTGAVAHKMGRRWIMVELGEHCHTHIIPRLKKVIDGADPGGITDAVGWKGGGGFRYYRVAPSLLEKDKWGNWVINPAFNAAMLAEAVCKVEGFTYAPSESVYWQHGRSTERDFIYVTTQTLNHDQLQQLSDEVGPERSLLVMCAAFRSKAEGFPNLTIKKIPKAVLTRCEYGKDDYSLRVENLPKAPPPAGQHQLPGKSRHHLPHKRPNSWTPSYRPRRPVRKGNGGSIRAALLTVLAVVAIAAAALVRFPPAATCFGRIPAGVLESARVPDLLAQLHDPGRWDRAYFATIDFQNNALRWRLLPPTLGRILHLEGRGYLALGWVAIALMLGAAVHYGRALGLSRAQLAAAGLLVATSSALLAPAAWIGCFDGFYLCALLVAAFSPSAIVAGAACALGPWCDEKFLFVLPLVLLIRRRARGEGWRQLLGLAACTAPYELARLIAIAAGDTSVARQLWLQQRGFASYALTIPGGWLLGFRLGWVLVVAGAVRLWKPAGPGGRWLEAAALAIAIVPVACLAWDTTRSAAELLPLLLFGAPAIARRPGWLVALALVNLALPAAYFSGAVPMLIKF